MDTKELLGEELYAQVTEALKGKGRDGKDLEFVLTNTGDYVPASKYDGLKEKYNKVSTDYDTLNSKYESDIASIKAEGDNRLKTILIANELGNAGIAKVNGNYDVYLKSGAIDVSSVVIENDKLVGADAVINAFVASNPNLVLKVEPVAQTTPVEAVPATTGLNPTSPVGNTKDLAYYKDAYDKAVGLTDKMAIKRQASEEGISI
jgi:hypothetical protein